MPRWTWFASASLSIAALALAGSPTASAPTAGRPVETTFAFFGCNRVDPADWEETRRENPSSANLPQLKQTLADVANLAPDLLFFGGDLVLGYADDQGEALRSQMSAWIGFVNSRPRAKKTQYVAISGNHELNRKVHGDKLPNLSADAAWTSLVTQGGLMPPGTNGPTPLNDFNDRLVDDQRALSFSFNRGATHFVVLNTDTRVSSIDPTTGQTKIAMIPVRWLDADLDLAERDSKIKAVIVLGHRNMIDPESVKGDAPIDPDCAASMIKSLERHWKVRAYVCAHVHAFDISPIGSSGLRQTCFGNGGSSLEKSWDPPKGRTFGFGYFRVYKDGSLGVIPYFRPAPKNYLAADKTEVPPAQPQPELIIPARSAPAHAPALLKH